MEQYFPAYKVVFNQEEEGKEFILMGFKERFVYKNNVKTDEIDGYKASLLTEDYRELVVNLNVADLNSLNVKIGSKVKVVYDSVRSKLYVRNGFITPSIWSTLVPVEGSDY